MGQERLKEALLVVATDDGLDGLLVSGEKGTGKSTLVRGLADLLPDQQAVADCPYGCPPDDRSRQCADCRERATVPVEERSVPLVTLPLGATRERVVGTLSVPDALAGEAEFDPGLLARANRGVLYVDEVNLLDDHVVDVLLDSAASGENRVERDGVSRSHPAEFTLVGTMNPEEGDLRPQLRDRFALSVQVRGERDVDDRVAVIDRDLQGPPDRGETQAHSRRLRRGRTSIGSVALSDEQKRKIAELCLEAGVDGHRADIAAARAARSLAALDGRPTVTDGDLKRAARLALGHRMRSAPFEDAPDADEVIDDHFQPRGGDTGEQTPDTDDAASDASSPPDGESRAESEANDDEDARDDQVDGGEDQPGDTADGDRDARDGPVDDDGDTREDTSDGDRGVDTSDGDRGVDTDPEADGRSPEADGRYGVGGPATERPDAAREEADAADGVGQANEGEAGEEDDGAERATPLLPGQQRGEPASAAAPDLEAPQSDGANGAGRATAAPSTANHGARVRTEATDGESGVDVAASVRAAASRGSSHVERRDLRRSVRSGDSEALVVFALDASASMRPAMRYAKGVTLELLEDAYVQRDSVAVVAFAGENAEVLLPPTDSVTLAARHLKELPTGDRTPLPAGLRAAAAVVDRADPEAAVVVVVSDGRANAAEEPTGDTRRAATALADTGARVVCVDAGENRGLLADVVAATAGERVPLDALTPERVERAVGAARR